MKVEENAAGDRPRGSEGGRDFAGRHNAKGLVAKNGFPRAPEARAAQVDKNFRRAA